MTRKISSSSAAVAPACRTAGIRRAAQTLLLGFVATTLVVAIVKNIGRGPGVPMEKPLPHQVIVYFFHDNQRCEACERIERFSREAVAAFPDAVKSGLLEWRAVNRVDPENENYVRQFHLVTQTVVVADLHDGRITNCKILDDVLNRHENREALIAYIQEPIRQYLGAQDGVNPRGDEKTQRTISFLSRRARAFAAKGAG